MRVYKFKSKYFCFQLSLPRGWRGAPVRDFIINVMEANNFSKNPVGRPSVTRIIVGPKGSHLNFIITSLAKNEKEPTVEETAEYFDGLSYRQNLVVVDTGSIRVAGKDHFWAKYQRRAQLGNSVFQFVKKYSLYLNRFEVLITAGFQITSSPQDFMSGSEIKELESTFDEIVSSITPLKGQEAFT